MSMKVLVTGGSGFIGTHVVKGLINKGYSVVNCDLTITTRVYQEYLTEEERSKVTFVKGSIINLPLLLRTVKEHGIEKIIHLAGALSEVCSADPILGIETNCVGTANIFETAKLFGLKRVVWASTVNVFGKGNEYPYSPIDDSAPHIPHNLYGACKSFNERLGEHYYDHFHVDNIGLRFTSVYGFGRDSGSGSFITKMAKAIVYGEDIVAQFVNEVVDFEYIDDTVRAILLALEAQSPTKTRVFTTGGESRKIQEAVNYLLKLSPASKVVYPPVDKDDNYLKTLPRPQLDKTAIRIELGYVPQFTLEKGLDRLVADEYKYKAK